MTFDRVFNRPLTPILFPSMIWRLFYFFNSYGFKVTATMHGKYNFFFIITFTFKLLSFNTALCIPWPLFYVYLFQQKTSNHISALREGISTCDQNIVCHDLCAQESVLFWLAHCQCCVYIWSAKIQSLVPCLSFLSLQQKAQCSEIYKTNTRDRKWHASVINHSWGRRRCISTISRIALLTSNQNKRQRVLDSDPYLSFVYVSMNPAAYGLVFVTQTRVNYSSSDKKREQGQERHTELCCQKESLGCSREVYWSIRTLDSMPLNLSWAVTPKKTFNLGLFVACMDEERHYLEFWPFTDMLRRKQKES